MSHPETWAKKTRPTRGDVCLTQRRGQKKQDLLGGDVCLTQRRGQKKARPTRGDVCLTQRCGQKKQDPCGVGGTVCALPYGTNSTLSPPTGLGRRGLLMPLLPLTEHGSSPMFPQIREGLIVALPSISSPY